MLALPGLGLLVACGAARQTPVTVPEEHEAPVNRLLREEKPFLRDPLDGYPLVLTPAASARIESAFEALTAGDAAAARSAAAELLGADPGLAPASVLVAQTDLIAGQPSWVVERLAPIREELPGYTAARLLLGRAQEKLGRVVEAYAAYREVAEEPATSRAASLETQALEAVASWVEDSLRRGRLDEAREELERLESWAPEATETLAAAAQVALAWGDGEGELEAVRRLAQRFPDDVERQQRWADLEVEVGDPSQGLQLLRRLAAEHPGDLEIEDRLAYAKFRWRLAQMPAEVRDLGAEPELSRGDFAVLLYWLVPSVRYGRPAAARIATDILDDPRRAAIARVVNLGVMDVDETLHKFSPNQPLKRVDAWASLLRLLASSEEPLACVQDLAVRPSWGAVCATAAACDLVPREGECLPLAPVSGREVLEAVRRTLDLLEAR